MKKIKVGVIGIGFIGKQHIEAIRRIPGTEVVAISDNNADMVKNVGLEMDIDKCFTDYKDMLSIDEIDVIHNCTPSGMHYQINKDIIESGKHVYCEKPLTLTADEAKELVMLAKERKISAATNFNYRHNAMVREMQELISQKKIGEILLVNGQYLQDWLLYDTDYDWRMDPKLGGNSRAVSDIGSHCFDTIQFILQKKITSVFANLITVYPIRKRTEKGNGTFSSSGKVLEEVKISSEDAAFIMVKMEDGTQGIINISQVSAGKKNNFMINVNGNKASLEWNQERADKLVIGKRDSGNEEIYVGPQYLSGHAVQYATLPAGHSVGWADALKNAINSSYCSIRNNSYMDKTQGYATFEDAHYIMKIVEACIKSSKTKTWIDIK